MAGLLAQEAVLFIGTALHGQSRMAQQNITARELDSVYALATNEVWITGRDENQGGRTCANGSAIILRYTGAWSCQNTGAANTTLQVYLHVP